MNVSETTDGTPAAPGMVRRTMLSTAGGLLLAGSAGKASTADAAPAGRDRRKSTGFATFEWLGTSGWRIVTPTSTLLVDPYLTRFDTGLAAGRFNATTPLTLDTTAIDAALGAPGTDRGSVDAILVTHTHWDHFADVPHIAASRDAPVFTTLSGYHLGQSMGLPAGRLAVVKGGEELRIGDAVVRVISSRHSRTDSGGLLFPGVRTNVPDPPATIADLPEGDTLGFVIRRGDGSGGVLLLGASDHDDHELRGLGVDTVALPVPSNDVTVDYVGRLLRALDLPRTVVLVHWDDFERPLHNPPRTDAASRRRIRTVISEIGRVSPRTRVVQPTYRAPMEML